MKYLEVWLWHCMKSGEIINRTELILFVSIVIYALLHNREYVELKTWIYENRTDQWVKMTGKFLASIGPSVGTNFYFIKYVFNEADMDVPTVKNLKIKLRRSYKIILIPLSLIIIVFFAGAVAKGLDFN